MARANPVGTTARSPGAITSSPSTHAHRSCPALAAVAGRGSGMSASRAPRTRNRRSSGAGSEPGMAHLGLEDRGAADLLEPVDHALQLGLLDEHLDREPRGVAR